jgi:hypothetical protein
VEIPTSFWLAVILPRFMKLKFSRPVSPTNGPTTIGAALDPATDGAMTTAGAVAEFVTRPTGVKPSPVPMGPEFRNPPPTVAPMAMPEPLSGSTFSAVKVAAPRNDRTPLLVKLPVIGEVVLTPVVPTPVP